MLAHFSSCQIKKYGRRGCRKKQMANYKKTNILIPQVPLRLSGLEIFLFASSESGTTKRWFNNMRIKQRVYYDCFSFDCSIMFQDKLYDEILSVVGKEGHIGMQDLLRMTYLDQVYNETLRFFLIVPFIARRTTHDITLGMSLIYQVLLVSEPQ